MEEGYHVLKTIPYDTYVSLREEYKNRMKDPNRTKYELENSGTGVIKRAQSLVNILNRADELFVKAGIEIKRKLVGLIFPKKFRISENKVRTNYVHLAILEIINEIKALEGNKKWAEAIFGLQPTQAPRAGLEPATP